MQLPIDPTAIDPGDIGEERATLHMEHTAAIEHVRSVCAETGFGVPVEFSPSDLLNEKVGSGRDPYYVLGACSPEMADRALDVTPNIGTLFPCNFIIREVEPGVQEVHHVSIMRIAWLVGLAPQSDDWAQIVAETGEMVDEAFTMLRAS